MEKCVFGFYVFFCFFSNHKYQFCSPVVLYVFLYFLHATRNSLLATLGRDRGDAKVLVVHHPYLSLVYRGLLFMCFLYFLHTNTKFSTRHTSARSRTRQEGVSEGGKPHAVIGLYSFSTTRPSNGDPAYPPDASSA